MKNSFIAFAIALLSMSFMHEYYVSIFKLNYNAEEKLLECELKVFGDDLEVYLEKEGFGKLALSKASNKLDIDKALNILVQDNFIYSTEKQKVKELSYLGFEVDGDLVWIYFTVNQLKKPKTPTLSISWMQKLFSSQMNIVHFKTPQKELSEYFNTDKNQITFNFE